jgi:hypothetical protein
VGRYSIVWAIKVSKKKYNKNKTRPGLRLPPHNILHATTNQKHTGVTEEMKEKRSDWGGAWRKRNTIILRTNKFGGGKKLK